MNLIINYIKNRHKELISQFFVIGVLSFILEIMTVFKWNACLNCEDRFAYMLYVYKNIRYQRVAIYFIIIFNVMLMARDFGKYKRTIYKYRWYIGVSFIAFCTIFKLHGSSIGWISMLLENTDRSNLFGVFRPIRSDEYVVFTEMAISQARTGFKWFSDVWGYSSSDMFIIYGQPVFNLVTIFRPFTLGYILLGDEMGLAFYWSSRFAVCLLVSFEFGRQFTIGNNKLALLYSVLVVFSPLVQWWYSINELVEIIIFGQGAILIISSYLNEESFRKKAMLIALFILCAGGYVLSFYPAWMIPFFYIFAFFGAAVLIENRQKLNIKREDLVLFSLCALILAFLFLYIWSRSKETILSEINTVYPGERNEKGNLKNIVELFRGWTSYFWTIIKINNPCEEVDFLSLFPLGVILSLITFKQKDNDYLLKCLLACNAFLIGFLLLSLPDWLTSITMMKSVTGGRNVTAIGYLNLIILIRALSKTKWERVMVKYLFIPGIISVLVGLYKAESNLDDAQKIIAVVIGILQIALLLAFCKGKQEGFITLMLSLSIIGGAFVNPVSTGLDSLFETEIYKKIKYINKQDNGLWAVVNGGISLNDLPTTAGAHTINAVSTYPDYILWEKIGMQDKKEIWNRYAHINIQLSEKNDLKLINPDALELSLNLQTLKSLGVKYLLVVGELQEEKDLVELFEYENVKIYTFR